MGINSINSANINVQSLKGIKDSFESKVAQSNEYSNNRNISFGNYGMPVVNTQLRTQEEFIKYNILQKISTPKTKQALERLLKTGVLLNNNSDDKTTTLDNLCNIFMQPRIIGLDALNIYEDTVKRLDNPYIITQHFGDIPKNLLPHVLEYEKQQRIEKINNGENINDDEPLTPKTFDITSSSCVAASIEFNLAHRQPAEFARMVQELSSEKHSVDKTIDLKSISKNTLEARWLLKEFNSNYGIINHDNIKIKLEPDRNAIIRARIQTAYKDRLERSPVDVLMQSTFMNTGSQKTYNSLTDTRTGKFNPDNKGLTDLEKNLTEVLATGKSKISVNYQKLDEDGKIIGYECDFKTMEQQITDALKMGENVIIGYTYTDDNNVVLGGHEITIVGLKTDEKGNSYFICNDTDDDISKPIIYPVKEFLPKIHHAGLPVQVLKEDVEFVESWQDTLVEIKKNRFSK